MPQTPREHDEPSLYDPPPPPPGLDLASAYAAQVYAHGVRYQERASGERHHELLRALRTEERQRGPGILGWASSVLGRLPPAIQQGLVLSGFWLLTQLGGAVYERLTGRAPPQPSQPTYTSPLTPVPSATAQEP